VKYWIIVVFLATAPLGKLIPMPGTPHSFRFFYLLMAASIPLLLMRSVSRRIALFIASQLPFLFYLLWSALYTYSPGSVEGAEGNPIFRAILLGVELIFIALIASRFQRETLSIRLRLLLLIPLASYLLSMAVGYVFFVGYYAGVLSQMMIEPFHVLLQFGYGILRFSPGSYPNEYGIVSSFFASVVLMLLLRWPLLTQALGVSTRRMRLLRWLLLLCFPLMLGALFLASTRAAYLSFMVTALVLGLRLKTTMGRIRYFGSAAVFLVAVLAVVQQYFDILGFFNVAYTAFFDESASAHTRFSDWAKAYDGFKVVPWLGTGFGTTEFIHNVYLQVLFGTGLIGALLFAFFFVALQSARQPSGEIPPSAHPGRDSASLQLLRSIGYIAVFHTLWFGGSNHNFNHFLTWYTVLLVLMMPLRPRALASASPSAPASCTRSTYGATV
jgi:O-antigen ligase